MIRDFVDIAQAPSPVNGAADFTSVVATHTWLGDHDGREVCRSIHEKNQG